MTDARDRPILMSAPMVRATLDGRKTQTRRVIKPQPSAGVRFSPFVASGIEDGHGREIRMPWRPGDRAWVRETWACLDSKPRPGSRVAYRASTDGDRVRVDAPWHPSIHMPRWASRLTLLIEDVRVQRLQDISANDAEAEGICIAGPDVEIYRREAERYHEAARRWNAYRLRQFHNLWNSIYGPDAWFDNPWVAALTFRPVFANIDSLKEAA